MITTIMEKKSSLREHQTIKGNKSNTNGKNSKDDFIDVLLTTSRYYRNQSAVTRRRDATTDGAVVDIMTQQRIKQKGCSKVVGYRSPTNWIFPLMFFIHFLILLSCSTEAVGAVVGLHLEEEEEDIAKSATTVSLGGVITTAATTTTNRNSISISNNNPGRIVVSQSLKAPFYGKHVGLAYVDLNGDGALDLLFAAGRHWVDQCYALINLGPLLYYNNSQRSSSYSSGGGEEEKKEFHGIKFSKPLKLGPPGSYYQVDVVTTTTTKTKRSTTTSSTTTTKLQPPKPQKRTPPTTTTTTVLLVGGTCHHSEPNSFGYCMKGQNTSARVLEVTMPTNVTGCNIFSNNNDDDDDQCELYWNEIWSHPNPLGDRNGGFVHNLGPSSSSSSLKSNFNNNNNHDDDDGGSSANFALLGQGGIEIFFATNRKQNYNNTNEMMGQQQTYYTDYERIFHLELLPKINRQSDFPRYAGFATGYLPKLGPVLAAGRRTDVDPPQTDKNGNIIGINVLVYKNNSKFHMVGDDDDDSKPSSNFVASFLPSNITGEPYPGNKSYSIQSTNYAFDDINGDGIEDLLEATTIDLSDAVIGYPLPQRVHFFDRYGQIKESKTILESKEGDAGRSVTTGQIFDTSTLSDVVFASVKGIVTIFANMGINKDTGLWMGLQQRYEFDIAAAAARPDQHQQRACEVRDVAVVPLLTMVQPTRTEHNQQPPQNSNNSTASKKNKCWVGIVCAVACNDLHVKGNNHIFYIEGDEAACIGANGKTAATLAL